MASSLLHRVLRKPFFGRFEVPWTWPSADMAANWERVTIDSDNGARLAGLWGVARHDVAEAMPARGALVLAHPMGKAAKGFWLRHGHADLFRSVGYHVLLIDANGFGESEPRSFDYPSDFLAAGRFAQTRATSLPVGLVGASFGAGWGLVAMSREASPYRAAVLEGAFPTLPEFWKHYPFAHAMLRASQFVAPRMERALRPEEAARRVVGAPAVLLLHGDADVYTPPAFGERLQRALSEVASHVEMKVLPGIGHTFAYRDAASAYRETVLGFLHQHLR
jgi:pimeloyl-ACP methyl ester carboxylesterase